MTTEHGPTESGAQLLRGRRKQDRAFVAALALDAFMILVIGITFARHGSDWGVRLILSPTPFVVTFLLLAVLVATWGWWRPTYETPFRLLGVMTLLAVVSMLVMAASLLFPEPMGADRTFLIALWVFAGFGLSSMVLGLWWFAWGRRS